MSEILESIFDNKKNYETIAAYRSVYYPDEAKALELVKKFIIKKKRILYGGMAIDLNLKKAGHEGIYAKDVIPDYDFMSPDFYNDSNELAQILHEAGLPNVSAINAAHITSRRVRINFIGVADLTYIPAEIYDRLPTVVYDKMRVIHPDFQRMDIHRAFSIPFSNPPMEVILHRLNKDQKRFRLLAENYPLIVDKNTKLNFTSREYTVDKSWLADGLITGMPGYALLIKFIKTVDKTFIDPLKTDVIFEKNIIKFILPDHEISKLSVLSDYPLELLRKLKLSKDNIKYYNKYLDNLLPRRIIAQTQTQVYELLDNKTELTPCYNLQKSIDVCGLDAGPKNNDKIFIGHPNYLLLYFLVNSFIDEKNKNLYRYIYNIIIDVVVLAEHKKCDAADYVYQPFFMPVQTYGDFNWSSTYIHLVLERNNRDLPDKPMLRPMFGYYPERANTWPDFDPRSSFLYHIDGKLIENFTEIKLDKK